MDQTVPQNRDDSRETKLIWSHKSNMYHVRSIAPCINNLGLITSSHNRLNQQKMACQVGNHAHQMSMMVMVWFGLVDSLHSTMQGFSPFHKKTTGQYILDWWKMEQIFEDAATSTPSPLRPMLAMVANITSHKKMRYGKISWISIIYASFIPMLVVAEVC